MTLHQPDLPWDPPLPEVTAPPSRVTQFFNIADTRAEYDMRAHRGYRNASGRIYLRCWYHRERTPSMVVYPDEPQVLHHFDWSKGRTRGRGPLPGFYRREVLPGTMRAAHFHCYGCGTGGSEAKLINDLLDRQDGGISEAEVQQIARRAEQWATGQLSDQPIFTESSDTGADGSDEPDIPF